MRRHSRIDAWHREAVDYLRSMGASVQSLADIGKGCPDLLIGWRGRNYLIEIKDGRKPPSQRKLTDLEVTWHKQWYGQIHVIETLSALHDWLLHLDRIAG